MFPHHRQQHVRKPNGGATGQQRKASTSQIMLNWKLIDYSKYTRMYVHPSYKSMRLMSGI